MSDQFQVIIVDDPQTLVVQIDNPVSPDIEVQISPDPTALVVEVDNGIPGVPGPVGPGVPVGGSSGQALTKVDGTNYNTQWSTVDKAFVGLGNVDNTSDLNKPISTATQTALNAKQDLIGYTPENVANKSTNTSLGTSDTLYPSQNAVKTYVDAAVVAGATPDATTLVKGKVKLAGDLGGTADLPTVPGLAGKEPIIAPGTTSQYWRGDKTWQTFPTIITDHGALTGLGDNDHPQYLLVNDFDAQNVLQKEPTGYPNRTDSVLSFVDGTRTFTIAPAVTSFDVYVKGTKFTKSTPQSIVIPAFSGNHYIYFDNTGALQTTQVFDSAIIQDNAFTSIVYWNNDTNSHTYFAEERHGLVMDGMTHSYLHTVFGSRYLSGLALLGFSVNGTGNLAANAQFTADSGSIRDEDILLQSLAQAQIPILYRQGALWRKKAADSFPVIYSGTAGYTGASGRLPYNQLVSGSWQLTEVVNNGFVLVHFFATNDQDNPIVGIQGIATYNNVTDARLNANSEIATLSGLPFAEFVPIGSVIFETANGYTNAPKARVRSTDTGANYVDFRGTQLLTASTGQISNHSLLSNLASDDHLQYHTDARGDARYYTKTQVDALTIVRALVFG